MQAKKYIICGVPRAGKSTLARHVASSIGCAHIPLDPLMTAFATQYPDSGITLSMECNTQTYLAICRVATMFWIAYIKGLDKEFDSYVVEGFHLDIDMIVEAFGNTHTIVIVGYPSLSYQEKIDAIKTYDTSNRCWTYGMGYDALVEQTQWFCGLSQLFQKIAKKYNLRFVDTSYMYTDAIQHALQALL